MKYLVDDIVKAVRIAMEVNDSSAQLFDAGDIDTLSMDDIIKAKIVPAIRHIESNAAVYLLDAGKSIDSMISWYNEDTPGIGSGYLVLPDDFMRLLTFQMTDWVRPATIITPDSPLYPLQSSQWSGVKGNPDVPVVAIVPSSLGLILEIHSCIAGEKVGIKNARYIPMPYVDSNDMVSCCQKLYDAAVLYCASLVASTYQNVQYSMILKQQAYDLAGIVTSQVPPSSVTDDE